MYHVQGNCPDGACFASDCSIHSLCTCEHLTDCPRIFLGPCLDALIPCIPIDYVMPRTLMYTTTCRRLDVLACRLQYRQQLAALATAQERHCSSAAPPAAFPAAAAEAAAGAPPAGAAGATRLADPRVAGQLLQMHQLLASGLLPVRDQCRTLGAASAAAVPQPAVGMGEQRGAARGAGAAGGEAASVESAVGACVQALQPLLKDVSAAAAGAVEGARRDVGVPGADAVDVVAAAGERLTAALSQVSAPSVRTHARVHMCMPCHMCRLIVWCICLAVPCPGLVGGSPSDEPCGRLLEGAKRAKGGPSLGCS